MRHWVLLEPCVPAEADTVAASSGQHPLPAAGPGARSCAPVPFRTGRQSRYTPAPSARAVTEPVVWVGPTERAVMWAWSRKLRGGSWDMGGPGDGRVCGRGLGAGVGGAVVGGAGLGPEVGAGQEEGLVVVSWWL